MNINVMQYTAPMPLVMDSNLIRPIGHGTQWSVDIIVLVVVIDSIRIRHDWMIDQNLTHDRLCFVGKKFKR